MENASIILCVVLGLLVALLACLQIMRSYKFDTLRKLRNKHTSKQYDCDQGALLDRHELDMLKSEVLSIKQEIERIERVHYFRLFLEKYLP